MIRRLLWLPVVALSLAAAGSAQAGEPARAFLDALRERKYFDVAIDYLDAAAKDPAVPASFKETLLYEKGVTLVDGARFQRDSSLRETQLDEAQKVLQQFVSEQPSHLFTSAARSQLGNVMVSRAKNRVEKSKKTASNTERQALLKQARGLYDEAGKVFSATVEELRNKLKAYPALMDEKKEAKRIEERDRYRTDFLQSQLLVAAAREESADTLEKGSKEWTEALTTAADEYKKFYEAYRTRIAGLYARLYQGRCLQTLGKHKDATAYFNELLANDDSTPELRSLKLKVMSLAVDSWMAQELYAEVIAKAAPLVDSARPSEDKTDDMMGLRLTVAKACKAYAQQLKAKKPGDTQVRKLLTDGRKYVSYVTRFPNDYQEAARKLLPDFSGGDAEVAQRPEPKTFLDARTATKDALDAMQSAHLLERTLPSRIAASKSPEKEEFQKQLEDAKQQAAKSQNDASHYCRLAMKLIDKDTEVADVNLIRYWLCYLLFNEGEYYDSIVIGEFLAKRYPESPGSRAAAKIALAGYLRLFAESTSEDKEFETQQVMAMADYIVKQWPDQPEAAEALNTLIPFMIREHKLQQAQDYLAKIPADSPQRGTAELKTGQALWDAYIEGSKQLRDWENGVQPPPERVDLAKQKQELEALKTKAKETLVEGVNRMRKADEISHVLPRAVLSLAQIYVDTNEAAKAVELIEHPKIGALTLVRNKDPASQKEGFPEETYKTALRATISSLAGGGDTAAKVKKARDLMESLKAHMGQTPQAQQKLVGIYFSLARDLQRQMEIAEPSVKKSLGVGFESFLSEVATGTTELNILNWVAETYRGMGESFGTGFKALTPEAKGYFEKAAETYQKILEKGKTDTNFLSTPMKTQILIQLAKTEKFKGEYKGAANMYEDILKANPLLLTVQIEAARLYQDWGGTGKGQQENYMKAIVGTRQDEKTKRNVFWGWGEIASKTANNPQYKEQFHEARYNLALCRYNYAVAQTDAAAKKKQMEMARRDIAITAGFYPDLGGDTWKNQYENLLKNVQKALGEKPIGLAGLKSSATAAEAPKGPTPVSTTAPSKKK